MSHLPLDARAILQHLNELGYRNISAEQLREFLKDLRKLIKYEEHLATNSKEDYFSSLYKRNTISSRAKLGEIEQEIEKQIIPDKKRKQRSDKVVERLPSGKCSTANNLNLASMLRDKLLIEATQEPQNSTDCVRRSRSKTPKPLKETDRDTLHGDICPTPDTKVLRRSKLNKSRSGRNSALVCSQTKYRAKQPRNDPVALYQYYQNEWTHFRDQIPGENSHSDLRWEIRHKLDPK